MAKYSMYFFCDECAKVHPLGIAIPGIATYRKHDPVPEYGEDDFPER